MPTEPMIADDIVEESDAAVTEPRAAEMMTEGDDSDEGPLDLPTSAFTPVNFQQASRRVIDLYRSYSADKELDPRPSFQRGYVWDRNRATKLIESILLHVPIPLIYTSEEDNGLEVVIDGQQRLTTCFAFIDGFFPMSKSEDERASRGESVRRRPFRLGKLKILSHLKGKSYSDLPRDLKDIFNRYNLTIIKISKDSHPDVKFEIFERLNTGSVSLSDQEIRNCIYRGPYNNLLVSLASEDKFRKLLGIAGEAIRMQDVELVLRFMAFNEATHLNYNQKMRAFLNNHMRDRKNISEEMALKYRSAFLHSIDLAYTVFGEKAFRRFSEGNVRNPSGNWERAVNKAVYDVLMFWFARYEKRQIVEKKDAIREKFIQMCVEDKEFTDAITLGTADAGRVRVRFDRWAAALEEVITVRANERRAFSFAEKSRLFDADPSCCLCHQQISEIDDAEVDHSIPYSSGGATDLSNAQLAHRYCNRAKGASEAGAVSGHS